MINKYKLSIFVPVFPEIMGWGDFKWIMRAKSNDEAHKRICTTLTTNTSNKNDPDFHIIKTLIDRLKSPEHELVFLIGALHQVLKLDDANRFKAQLKKSISVVLLNYLAAFLETGLLSGMFINTMFYNPVLSLSNCIRMLSIFTIDRLAEVLNAKYIESQISGERFSLDSDSAEKILMQVFKELTGIRDLATIKKYFNTIFEKTSDFAKSNFSFFYNLRPTTELPEQQTRMLNNAVIDDDYLALPRVSF